MSDTESAAIADAERAPTPESKLARQDLSRLNVEELTPLTSDVISRQATVNVGTIGHVGM